jgi:LysR family glycine cleavage system transcriptional activator
LPLSALRAFESASRCLHLGQAGEALGVTHGAISHQIKSLEAHLNTRLFTRENNRLALTSDGVRLFAAVQQGFDAIVDGMLHIDPENIAGVLTIGCTASTAENWGVHHVMGFQQQYPDIEIDVVEIKPRQQNISRNIDVAICYGRPTDSSRSIELLSDLPIFPVGNPKLLYDRKRITQPKQLLDFQLLGDNQNNWSDWFSVMKVATTSKLNQTQFFNTALSLNAARSGHGIALGNPFEIYNDLKEGRLVKFINQSIPEASNYFLLRNSPDKESLRANLFCQWIKRRVSPPLPAN